MILYHPYDDVYHCFCRVILLVSHLPVEDYEYKKIQILDFYFLFPGLLKDIIFPSDLRIYRSYVNKIKNPYSDINDPKQIISHIEHHMNYVTRYMAAYGLIDIQKFKTGIIYKINPEMYYPITQNIEGYDKDLINFLVTVLSRIPLNGKYGLKARTNFFEYRYDND